MFPLKLADKKVKINALEILHIFLHNIGDVKFNIFNSILFKSAPIVPNHSRTGSSPAVIQQPIMTQQQSPPYPNPPQYQMSPMQQQQQQPSNPATRYNF